MTSGKSSQPEDFLGKISEAANLIRVHAEMGSFLRVVTHIDADGLAAGGIIGKALLRLNVCFRIRAEKQLDTSVIEELAGEKAPLIIFTDFGSGYVDIIKEKLSESSIIILDHHQPVDVSFSNLIHVNPHFYGFDGAREISGAGVAYFTAKVLNESNIDLACIAVVGALGDLQDKSKGRQLHGLNRRIVEDAVRSGYLETTTDLLFYGRETRPIHRALAYTTNPFIPSLSGEEDKCLGFLINLGIELKIRDKWRSVSDLKAKEKEKLYSELTKFLVSKGLSSQVPLSLVGMVYTLIREDRWTPLRDAREFSSLLNACGRMDKAGLGISICMGSRMGVLEESQKVYDEYRKMIAQYLNWLTSTPEAVRELENIYLIRGQDVIDEKMLGSVTSILTTTGFFKLDKPIIATTTTSNGMVKVSARASDKLIGKGLNLGLVLRKASQRFSGTGGGHDVAAGAQIPREKEEEFIILVDEFVEEQLKKVR